MAPRGRRRHTCCPTGPPRGPWVQLSAPWGHRDEPGGQSEAPGVHAETPRVHRGALSQAMDFDASAQFARLNFPGDFFGVYYGVKGHISLRDAAPAAAL